MLTLMMVSALLKCAKPLPLLCRQSNVKGEVRLSGALSHVPVHIDQCIKLPFSITQEH